MRASFAALIIATFVACSTYGETTPAPAPTAGGGDGGAPSDDASTDTAVETSTNAGVSCAGNAAKLCDDFEGRTVPSAHPKWNGIEVEGMSASALAIVPKQDGWESAFLRVTAPSLTATNGSWAYLEHDVPGSPASITIAFTVLVTGFDNAEYVEIASIVETATQRSYGIFLEEDQIKVGARNVGQLSIGGGHVCARYSMTVAGDAVVVRDSGGVELAKLAGPGPAFSAPIIAGIGVVYADPTPGGTIDVDDVTIDY